MSIADHEAYDKLLQHYKSQVTLLLLLYIFPPSLWSKGKSNELQKKRILEVHEGRSHVIDS